MIIQSKCKGNIPLYFINLCMIAMIILIGLCTDLAAEESSQAAATVSPAQIGFKYQEIKALYKKLAGKDNPEELGVLVERSADFVSSFPEYKRVDEVYYYLGNGLVRSEKVEEGIKIFEKLIEKHPEARYVQPSLLELGMAYDKLKKYDKADEIYTKLIEHPKYGSRSYAKQAKIYLEMEKSKRTGEIPKPQGTPSARPSEWIGKPAPEFKVKDLKGEELSLEKYKGQVVLLDFWATWCGPCIAELPNVKKTYQKYKDQKFQIIGISLDRSQQALETFVEKRELGWVHYWDQAGNVANQYKVTGIPSMFLLDGQGVIRKAGLRGHALGTAVAELVEENLTNPGGTPKIIPEPNTPPKSIPATKLIKPKAVPQSNPASQPTNIKVEDWVGKHAPDFQVKDLNGEDLSLEKYKGQVVLLDFWATWCPPCIKEIPKLKKVYEKYKDQNFQIIGVSLDRTMPPLAAYVQDEALAWVHYWDESREVRNQYGVRAIPTAFLIDGEGIIRKSSLGGFDVESAVAELMKDNLAKPVEVTPPTKTTDDLPEIGEGVDPEAKEVITAVIAAHGGLEKLKAVKNIVMESHSFEYFPDGTVQDEGRNKSYFYPNKSRTDWDMNDRSDSLIYNEDSLYQLTNGEAQPIPDDKLESIVSFYKDGLFREPIWLLSKLSQDEIPVKYLGTEEVGDETASVLLLPQPSGKKLKVFISEKTHYIIQFVYGFQIEGKDKKITATLDDYREVDGIMISHLRTTKNGEYRQILITDISLNAEIDDALFNPDTSDE